MAPDLRFSRLDYDLEDVSSPEAEDSPWGAYKTSVLSWDKRERERKKARLVASRWRRVAKRSASTDDQANRFREWQHQQRSPDALADEHASTALQKLFETFEENIAAGKPATHSISGREVELIKFTRLLRSKTTAASAPRPPVTLAPGLLRSYDEIIYSIKAYQHGSVDAGRWQLTHDRQWALVGARDTGRRQRRWNLRMLVARRMVSMGYLAQGFQLINMCLDQFPAMLRSNHPMVLHRILSTMFATGERQPELEELLWSYFTNAAAVVFNQEHPLYVIWSNLKKVERADAFGIIMTMAKVLFNVVYVVAERDDIKGTCAAESDSDAFEYPQSGGLQKHAAFLDHLLQNYDDIASKKPLCSRQDIVARLAHNYHMQGKLDESREMYEDLLQDLLPNPDSMEDEQMSERTQELALECHRAAWSIITEEGSEEEWRRAGYAMDDFCAAVFGTESERRLEPLLMMESMLRQLNRKREADAVMRRWQLIWSKSCKDGQLDDPC